MWTRIQILSLSEGRRNPWKALSRWQWGVCDVISEELPFSGKPSVAVHASGMSQIHQFLSRDPLYFPGIQRPQALKELEIPQLQRWEA